MGWGWEKLPGSQEPLIHRKVVEQGPPVDPEWSCKSQGGASTGWGFYLWENTLMQATCSRYHCIPCGVSCNNTAFFLRASGNQHWEFRSSILVGTSDVCLSASSHLVPHIPCSITKRLHTTSLSPDPPWWSRLFFFPRENMDSSSWYFELFFNY